MSNKPDTVKTGKCLFEVRFDPALELLDFRGGLATHLISELGLDAYKISENRIDVTKTDKLEAVYFVSTHNAGFQLENTTKIENAKETVNKFINALISFDKFHPKKIMRLGARWQHFTFKRSYTFEMIKTAFQTNVANPTPKIVSGFSGESIFDIGLPLRLQGDGYKCHVMSGPMKNDQLLAEVISNKKAYQIESIGHSGLFIDADAFSENLGGIDFNSIREKGEKLFEIAANHVTTLNGIVFDQQHG